MIARPESMTPVWRKVPSITQSSVAILRDRGHSIAVRINRNGSPRYSVDGGREMDAATLARRYKID